MTCYVYKTKKGTIFTVNLSGDTDEDIIINVFDHNIPPSPATLIGCFQANNMRDYVDKMIPILLEHLPEDKQLTKLVTQIMNKDIT